MFFYSDEDTSLNFISYKFILVIFPTFLEGQAYSLSWWNIKEVC